jgi:hypothetical protein
MKRFASGREGLLFLLNNQELLKIYKVSMIIDDVGTNFARLYGCRYIDEVLQERFDLLDDAHRSGLNVPKPLSIEKRPIEEIYASCGEHKKFESMMRKYHAVNPSFARMVSAIQGAGIRKQFIPGKTLDKNFLPSQELKHKVQKMYREFYDIGLIIADERPSNYLLDSNEELFMIDEGSIISKKRMRRDDPLYFKNETSGFHTYYSDRFLLAQYLLEGRIQNIKILLNMDKTNRAILKDRMLYSVKL